MKSTHTWIAVAITLIVVIGAFLYWPETAKTPSSKMPGDQQPSTESAGTEIIRTGCAASRVTVNTPAPTEFVAQSFPLSITVDNRGGDPKCTWTVFEAQAGTVEVYDMNGNRLAQTYISTTEDWMNLGPTTFTTTVNITKSLSTDMKIIITEEDPSGMGDVATVMIPVKSLAK